MTKTITVAVNIRLVGDRDIRYLVNLAKYHHFRFKHLQARTFAEACDTSSGAVLTTKETYLDMSRCFKETIKTLRSLHIHNLNIVVPIHV